MIENLMLDSQSSDCVIYLSGPNNFRKAVYPEYKANRIGKPRPRYEHAVKDYLRNSWQAVTVQEAIEADDAMGIHAMSGDNFILVHQDKDMNQIPGMHFRWATMRNGEVIRDKELYSVTLEEGNRFFYYQLIVGDTTDNIKGIPGMGPKKADAFLNSTDPQDWAEGILDLYGDDEIMDMNAQCVYIWRKPNDSWRNLLNAKT